MGIQILSMKLSYVYTLFVFGIIAFLSLASSGGRAGAQNWGNTGAPGDQMLGTEPRTCISCHGTAAAVQMEIALEIKDADGNVLNDGEYAPGETYSMTVSLNAAAGSPSGFGFQMLCLNAATDQNGPESSNYSNPGTNVQIATASNTARTYAEQSSTSPNSDFTVDWTAPEMGAGVVTFYVCGNGVNNNMSTSGDGAACTKVELAEDLTASAKDIVGLRELLLSPNPTQGEFVMTFRGTQQIQGQLMIQDVSGKLHHSETLIIPAGETIQQIAFDAPTSGLYFVQVQTPEGVRTEKLMVQ